MSRADRTVAGVAVLCTACILSAWTGHWAAFGICGWALLAVEFLLGVAGKERRRVVLWLALIVAAHAALLAALIAVTESSTPILGLPRGMGLLVYGVWPAGVLPSLFFSAVFERWVLPTQNVEKLLKKFGPAEDRA